MSARSSLQTSAPALDRRTVGAIRPAALPDRARRAPCPNSLPPLLAENASRSGCPLELTEAQIRVAHQWSEDSILPDAELLRRAWQSLIAWLRFAEGRGWSHHARSWKLRFSSSLGCVSDFHAFDDEPRKRPDVHLDAGGFKRLHVGTPLRHRNDRPRVPSRG